MGEVSVGPDGVRPRPDPKREDAPFDIEDDGDQGRHGDKPVHHEPPFRSFAISEKVLSAPSSNASLPVAFSQRRRATSTKAGEISIARQRRWSFSAAMIWLPEPEKGSRTMALKRVCCSIGISKRRVGFWVGCSFPTMRLFPSQSTSHTLSMSPYPCFGLWPRFQPKAQGS